jgi:hypothetical protein
LFACFPSPFVFVTEFQFWYHVKRGTSTPCFGFATVKNFYFAWSQVYVRVYCNTVVNCIIIGHDWTQMINRKRISMNSCAEDTQWGFLFLILSHS